MPTSVGHRAERGVGITPKRTGWVASFRVWFYVNQSYKDCLSETVCRVVESSCIASSYRQSEVSKRAVFGGSGGVAIPPRPDPSAPPTESGGHRTEDFNRKRWRSRWAVPGGAV
jgi:hypothetical protein